MGGGGGGGRLFEAGRLLTFSAFSMGAYSRWALIRGWALIRINTVYESVYGVSRKTQTITAESSGHNVEKKTFLSSIISDISLIHVTYFSSMVIVLVKFNLYLFLVL